MIFEIGKYYMHPGGEQLAIVGEVVTTLHGRCRVAESNRSHNLKPVGIGEGFAENWFEIKYEEWMLNFEPDIVSKTVEVPTDIVHVVEKPPTRKQDA